MRKETDVHRIINGGRRGLGPFEKDHAKKREGTPFFSEICRDIFNFGSGAEWRT